MGVTNHLLTGMILQVENGQKVVASQPTPPTPPQKIRSKTQEVDRRKSWVMSSGLHPKFIRP